VSSNLTPSAHMKTFHGIVQKGERRGATLGYKTANIKLDDPTVSGIYAARAHIEDTIYSAVVFIDEKRKLLETHVLDFPGGDLYGKEIVVELHERLRDIQKFEDDEKLKQQIADDIVRVRKFFDA